jgi:hypothetical protein
MKNMLRRVAPLLAALVALSAMAGGTASTVGATTFSDVNPLFCALNGGQTTRPAGTELRLRLGENSYDLGNLIAWRSAEMTTVSVFGGALIDLTNNFGPITFEDPFYVTRNFYDTGITLQPGASVSIVYDLELSHQVAFATNVGNVNPENHPVFFEPTTPLALGFPAAPWACTITGV